MLPSAEHEGSEPAPDGSSPSPALAVLDGGASAAAPASRSGNPLATASLAAGLCGFSVVTVVPGLVLGMLGLRRAARGQRGLARSWLGIGSSLAWAALAVALAPHLLRAADPGCAVYKGPALTAYGKVVADFRAAGPRPGLAPDLSVAISRVRGAAARSASRPAARALTRLAGDLRAVLSGIRARAGVPPRELSTLNRAATRADQACGTLRW